LSVLLRNWSAHRLRLQLFAAVLTPNITELVLFGFFVHNRGFYTSPNTFCQHFHVGRQLVMKKEISSKLTPEDNDKCSWPSGLVAGL